MTIPIIVILYSYKNYIYGDGRDNRNSLFFQKSRFIFLFAFTIIFLIIYPVYATDTMFRANPQHTGQYDNVEVGTANTELWRFSTGSEIETSPAIANGVIFVGGSDTIYALDANTGKENWEFASHGSISSPAVVNGIVYAGSVDDNLYALDANTGKQVWSFKTAGNISSSPAVVNGIVYAGSMDDNLYALDANTGKQVWSFKTAGNISSSPAISNGIVYIISNNDTWTDDLYALDASTGESKWSVPLDFAGFPTDSVISNGIIYISEPSLSKILAISATTGKKEWEISGDLWDPTIPAVSNGLIFIGSIAQTSDAVDMNNNPVLYDKRLYAFDETTGNMKWRFTGGGFMQSSPVVSNGIVYSGGDDGNLYAIDAATGKEKWHYSLGGAVTTDPLPSNGVIYVGCDDGDFIAIGNTRSPLTTTAATVVSTTLIQSTFSSTPNSETYNTNSIIATQIVQNTTSPTSFPNSRNSFLESIILIILGLLLASGIIGWTYRDYLKKHSAFLSNIITETEKLDWMKIQKIFGGIVITIIILLIIQAIMENSVSLPLIISSGFAGIMAAMKILEK
jgi:outer membrane protein assembly factor BamB